MPEIILEVRGLDRAIRTFGDTQLVRRHIGAALDKSAKLVQRVVTTYPPPLPNQHYVRTGTLGRSVATKLNMGRYEARIGTFLPYAPYVIGDGTQAAIHAGRWKTMGEVAQQEIGQITRFFVQAAEGIARDLEQGG